MGCKKAQGFLEQGDWSVSEVTDASKVKKARAEALALAKSVQRVVVGRGKKVIVIDMKKAPLADDELAGLLLGPSGNLKAPTIRLGETLLVGFSEEAYRQTLIG